MLLSFFGILSAQAQLKTSILLQSTDEDERINVSVDKSVYFPGDTVRLVIQRNDSTTAGTITPVLPIAGASLRSIGQRTHIAIIPQSVTPGSYPISLKVTDSEGRRFRYETDCVVAVEEYQEVEQLSRYVSIIPIAGSSNIRTPVTLDREQLENLEVHFQRDSIRLRKGPQFLRITTTVLLREGLAVRRTNAAW